MHTARDGSARAYRVPSAARAYRALGAARVYRALGATRVYRVPTGNGNCGSSF
jgi:hypothetical protein